MERRPWPRFDAATSTHAACDLIPITRSLERMANPVLADPSAAPEYKSAAEHWQAARELLHAARVELLQAAQILERLASRSPGRTP